MRGKLLCLFCIVWWGLTQGLCHKFFEEIHNFGIGVFSFLPVFAIWIRVLYWRIEQLEQDRWKIEEYNRIIEKENLTDFEYVDPREYWEDAKVSDDWLRKVFK